MGALIYCNINASALVIAIAVLSNMELVSSHDKYAFFHVLNAILLALPVLITLNNSHALGESLSPNTWPLSSAAIYLFQYVLYI